MLFDPELVGFALVLEEAGALTEIAAVGGRFLSGDLLLAGVDCATFESVKPPARVTTHIVPNSGCGPQEMPATL